MLLLQQERFRLGAKRDGIQNPQHDHQVYRGLGQGFPVGVGSIFAPQGIYGNVQKHFGL